MLPLVHRSEKSTEYRTKGHETEAEVTATILRLWDKGYYGVRVHVPDKAKPGMFKTWLVVRDANQLRSRFAVFDPARKDSADLLAGLGPMAVPAAGAGLLLGVAPEPGDDGR